MTDTERERVKMKVRKKEADGGLNTRLLYAGCRIRSGLGRLRKGDEALEIFHGQILNNTLPAVRP